METIQMIQEGTAMGNWWLAASSWLRAHSCVTSRAECFGETSNHTGDSAPHNHNLASCNFWLFPKLKSPLKGKRFQTVDEIHENMMEQLMAIERTVWGTKVLALKGTEVSLSYVQCFLNLVFSSINVSSFHITWWLDTWWAYLKYIHINQNIFYVSLYKNDGIFIIILFWKFKFVSTFLYFEIEFKNKFGNALIFYTAWCKTHISGYYKVHLK